MGYLLLPNMPMLTERSQVVQDTNKRTETIEGGVVRLNNFQDQEHRQEILAWLSPTVDDSSFESIITNRAQGTGSWLLESSEFMEWVEIDGTARTLYCPGIPGAGKTVMSAIVIDSLQGRLRAGLNIGIAYIFCNYRRHHSLGELLANLLVQLLRGQNVLDGDIKMLYERHKRTNTRASLDELRQALRSTSDAYDKVFYVVDALDECTDQTRVQLLTELFTQQIQSKSSFFATSRFNEETGRLLKDAVRMEIRASPEDVRNFVDSQINRFPGWLNTQPDLKEDLIKKIIAAAEGMYGSSYHCYAMAANSY